MKFLACPMCRRMTPVADGRLDHLCPACGAWILSRGKVVGRRADGLGSLLASEDLSTFCWRHGTFGVPMEHGYWLCPQGHEVVVVRGMVRAVVAEASP